ncbi:Re/Si-specific NAD(P)(+) transhydrogenase subunit alpha [Frankia sp. Cr1]|uniref:Re/Si-specific NAD(P)(+) transhydrogenase subunit alpha n=1 Tax=Frankia sp. Cr1 TaxID=3073931 RepID=UPI002AD3BE92|nr:Re/Si-specific NAD(P)(+) transhydrogenase subunit alpha [Frankia sp. Cr1]
MSSLSVGVVKESAPGERRVALVPEVVGRVFGAGFDVLVEAGAGSAAWFPDGAYAEAGAAIVTRDDLFARADVVLTVGQPDADTPASLHAGQTLVGLLQPLRNPAAMGALAAAGVTAVSLDGLPRTLSRAQAMDALTSQANVAGYKAVLVAADAYARYFPMLMTAAGTVRPAEVLVLGAGVAGLAAIGTAHRLGALVRGYDVRPQARGEIESLGASFLDLAGVASGAGQGGYARDLTVDELLAQQEALAAAVARHDVVITTAQVPGRHPPLLVTEKTIKMMRSGSVIVDLAASALGGNAELSVPGATVVTDNGVTVIGADNLPSEIPSAASTVYARNILALLEYLSHDGRFSIDTTDEIQAGIVITHDGRVVHPAIAELVAEPKDGS